MATKTQSSNYEKETIAIFWRAAWSNKPLVLRALINLVGVLCIAILVPFFVSMTFASLATGKTDVSNYLFWLVGVAVVGVACNVIGFTSFLRLQAKAQRDVLDNAFRRVLARSIGFHANTVSGKLVSNALDYPAAFGRLTDTVFVQMTPFALTMVIGIGIVLAHSLMMGLALSVVSGTTLGLIALESKRRSNWRTERKKVQNAMIAHVSDSIVNTQTIKTFAGEARELATHRHLSDELLGLRLRDWSAAARSGSIRMAVLLGLQVVFIAFVAQLIQRDPSILAIGIFSFTYMVTLTNRLFEVGAMIRNIEEGFLAAASMTEILLQDTEIVDAPDAKMLRVTRGQIDLGSVYFAYHDSSSDNVFAGLDLHIPAGQKIGLVGPSGGGKSTLTRLLLRFDDIDEGAITIDGQDIRAVAQASLRQAISYVPQEPLLFHRSIRQNIAYGRPKATLKQIEEAARLAFADEFIAKLPQGYDTVVGERGVKLSGGQRQRIAIARAILKNAPILILDEATSALDSESEQYIQKALEQLMQGRTTLVIAHRLSTIQKMDRIIVLSDGQIIEDGTHRSLQEQGGLYATLWAHQSGGFIEE